MNKSTTFVLPPLAAVGVSVLLWQAAAGAIKLDFNRNNLTYDWLTSIDYAFSRQGFSYNSSFVGESNLVKGGLSRWQENAAAKFIAEKSIIKRLSFTAGAEYKVNGLDRRRVRSAELSAGLLINPIDAFNIRPMLKVDRIHRSNLDVKRHDQGAGLGIETNVFPSNLFGINWSGSASYNKVKLTNIPSQEGSGTFNAFTSLFSNDTVWVNLRGLESAKKYYSSTARNDDVIVKQIKQEREGKFGLALTLPARMRLRVDGNAHLSRYLYRYPLQDDISAPQKDNYGRGGGYKAAVNGLLGNFASYWADYTWGRTSQDFVGLGLDQDAEVGELSIQGRVWLGHDSLSADMVFGVTSYTNPNINSNQQDRDQKTVLVNGRMLHYFSRFFSAGVSGGANSFRQTYVSGAWSANNNRNDTYILTPFAGWKPFERITVAQSFEIQANYITYDFDRKKLATKNRIFRRATSRTDIKAVISRRLVWEQGFLYRYEDYGQLIWDDGWQQAVSWDRRRSGLDTRLNYSPGRIVRLSPSFSWEKTDDYGHAVRPDASDEDLEEIRYLSDEQVKLLFRMELVIEWGQGRHMRADYSHRIRKFMERPKEKNDYVTISMEYLF